MTVCEHGSLRRQCPHCDVNRLERENADLRAQLDAANERLENNHVYVADPNDGLIRKDVKPGTFPDGITSRDETIRLQKECLITLRAQLDQAKNEALELCKLWGAATADMVERKANNISREHFDKIEDKVLHIQSIME